MGRGQDIESHAHRRHPREQVGHTPYPKVISEQRGKRKNADTQMEVREGERWPIPELLSGGRKPSCGQTMAQGGLCAPQPL